MLAGVFISYRREDSGGFAGRIYRLTNRLGRKNVFFDVDAIPPGLDFVDVLSDRVGKCDALLAIIGKHWVSSADSQNGRRLDDPSDFVRIEIEAALKRNVPVIPVLVDRAAMPQAGDLPDSLKKLTRRQAIEISHSRFDSDADTQRRSLNSRMSFASETPPRRSRRRGRLGPKRRPGPNRSGSRRRRRARRKRVRRPRLQAARISPPGHRDPKLPFPRPPSRRKGVRPFTSPCWGWPLLARLCLFSRNSERDKRSRPPAQMLRPRRRARP